MYIFDVVILHFDGASKGNPGKSGAGATLTSYRDSKLELNVQLKKNLGFKTNNQAEYAALKIGIDEVYERIKTDDFIFKKLVVKGDSELIIKQMNGEYKVKNQKLMKFYHDIQFKLKLIRENNVVITFEHIRREFNKGADALANAAIQ